jgi:hypothetical protein
MKFGIAVVLSLIIIGANDAQTHASSAAHSVTGYLSITTNPADATVYLDGQHVGVSPVQLLTVAAGEHRVRIVKTGYLENARVVTVGAGLAKNVDVKLTRTPATGQVVSRTGGGGGGSKKWLYIAAAGGAAAAAGVAVSNRNHAPSAATITALPTVTGIAAVTNFSFGAQGATDPDGDGLTLTWNFGDGGSATGATVSHVFAAAGSFNVSVTASDGKAEAKSADVPITVRNVSGTWVSNASGTIRTWTFTQSGTNVSGTYSNSASPGTPGTVTGSMTAQRAFSGTAGLTGFQSFTVAGTFDNAVSVLTVVANGSGFVGDTLTFTRQ